MAKSTQRTPRRDARVVKLALALLVGCSPAVRAAGYCPSSPVLAVDFVAGAGLAAVAVESYPQRPEVTIGAVTAALGVWLAANVAECER